MKNNKALGEDGIVVEAIKLGGSLLVVKIQELLNLCLYNQDISSTQWNNFDHKKGDKTKLENYRFISLLSHLYKLHTRILITRFETRLDLYQTIKQAGFRRYGTNNHLQYLKTLIEKLTEYNRCLALIFVDFRKAFDTMELSAILKTLEEC